jgi:malonyl-CoA O-methyltransferase
MLSYCLLWTATSIGGTLAIKYPDSYFDCVLSVEALEHAIDIERAIKEMVRILKPDGRIIIIDKNIAKIGVLEIKPWERWCKPEGIIALLKKYGVGAQYKKVAHEGYSRPNGLFIAGQE